MSDGCTGYWILEWIFKIHDCCAVHDLGGTDGVLLDCIEKAVPPQLWPAAIVCIALMALFRPLYHWLKGKK